MACQAFGPAAAMAGGHEAKPVGVSALDIGPSHGSGFASPYGGNEAPPDLLEKARRQSLVDQHITGSGAAEVRARPYKLIPLRKHDPAALIIELQVAPNRGRDFLD